MPLANGDVIDVGPRPPRRRRVWLVVFLSAVGAVFLITRLAPIYLSVLWFDSLGYSPVYWYIFKAKAGLFVVAALLTAATLSLTFWLFQKLFGSYAFENRTIILNNQPYSFSPAKFIRPLGWIIAVIVGLLFGLSIKDDWKKFALYFNQPPTTGADPIFGKSLGFYLFSLPVYQTIDSWLMGVTFIILCAALAYYMLGLPQAVLKPSVRWSSGAAFRAVCCALALFLLALSWKTYLARFPYLWADHQTF